MPSLTADQLVVLLLSRAPSDLSGDEVEALRSAVIDSPRIREKLFSELGAEARLREAFAHQKIDLDEVLHQAWLSDALKKQPLMAPFGWLAGATCGGLAALLALLALLQTPLWQKQGLVQGEQLAASPAEALLDEAAAIASETPAKQEPAVPAADPPENLQQPEVPPSEPPRIVSPPHVPPAAQKNPPPVMPPAAAGDQVAGTPPEKPQAEIVPPGDNEIEDPHPLNKQWNKEGYNVWVDIKGALELESYGDVCQLILNAPAEVERGLVPDLRDPELMISYSTLVALTMRDYPALRTTMREQFGALGRLRVNTAMARKDPAAVASLALQLSGTEAAAEADLWLGDLALSAGEFQQAEGHYQRALPEAGIGQSAILAARLRLAGAMQGREVGQPVTISVPYGDYVLSANDFERMVAELLNQRRDQAREDVGGLAAAKISEAPVPQPLKSVAWWQFDVGPSNLIGSTRPEGDWCGRCLTAAATNGLLVINNRGRLGAIDLTTGKELWNQNTKEVRSIPLRWYFCPFPPLIAGERIYARRVAGQGPTLDCIELRSGRVLWQVQAGRHIATQPLMIGGRLYVITVHSMGLRTPRERFSRLPKNLDDHSQMGLNLTLLDAETGDVLDSIPLVSIKDEWEDGRIPCGMALAGDTLVAIAGPALLSVDLTGELRWVRRLPWTGKEPVVPWYNQYYDDPLVDGDRLLIREPDSGTLASLDVHSGRLQWERHLPEVRRILGISQGHFIVQDEQGLLALDPATGVDRWRHPIDHPTEAFFLGGPGKLVYGRNELLSNDRYRPELVWLDPTTGKVVFRQTLAELIPFGSVLQKPLLGPLWSFNGRMFMGYDPNGEKTLRERQILELVPVK